MKGECTYDYFMYTFNNWRNRIGMSKRCCSTAIGSDHCVSHNLWCIQTCNPCIQTKKEIVKDWRVQSSSLFFFATITSPVMKRRCENEILRFYERLLVNNARIRIVGHRFNSRLGNCGILIVN